MNYYNLDELVQRLQSIGWHADYIRVDKPWTSTPIINCEMTPLAQTAESKQNRATKKPKQIPTVKRILKNGDYMTVLWEDGDKTIVKRAEDEAKSDYAAFTAALGIKCYGSNSALKRLVASAEVQGKKKKKQKEESPLKPIADKLSKICEVMAEANRGEKK